MDHTKELKHISLCTGYGGIDLGLSRALGAFRTVAYVEIEAFAIENLVSKIENKLLDVAPIWTNLKTFPWELFADRVDILSGGFPCQPFSGAGRREGDEDPRHLFPYIINGLRELGRPPIVFFENVEGILSSKLKSDGWNDPKGTPVLLHVLRELERLGYDATAGVFSASEVGATHQRKRVFIMGCRADLGESGRALVSSMLRDTESRGTVVEHTTSTRPQGSRSGKRSAGFFALPTESGTRDEGMAYSEHERLFQREHSPRHRKKLSTHRVLRTIYPTPRGANVEYTTSKGLEGGARTRVQMRSTRFTRTSTAYPAPRGAEQYGWEPPRVTMGDTNEPGLQGEVSTMDSGRSDAIDKVTTSRSSAHGNIQGEAQSSLGRDADGFTHRMDYAELCESLDNRTDELRLLGNGVVPDTAERAFRTLWRDLSGEEQR